MNVNECVYVVCYYPIGMPEDNPVWCAATFDGAEQAVFSFIEENEEEYQDSDHNWDDEWRGFTDKGTYVIKRLPLNP